MSPPDVHVEVPGGSKKIPNKKKKKKKKKKVLTGQFFMFCKVTQTTGKQSITEQKQWDKGAILNPRSFFARGMWEEAEEAFCAEGRIYVDIFQWNEISWVCKFHSHHISRRPAGRKSADLTFQHILPPSPPSPIQTGHDSWLYRSTETFWE